VIAGGSTSTTTASCSVDLPAITFLGKNDTDRSGAEQLGDRVQAHGDYPLTPAYADALAALQREPGQLLLAR